MERNVPIPNLPDVGDLTAKINRLASYRIVAGSLAAALLHDNSTVSEAVDRYFEVLAELQSRED